MRRCLAVTAVAVAVWLGSLAAPGWGWGGEPAGPIRFISPPSDVGLPMGQGIEVRYRAEAAAVLELRVLADRPAEATDISHLLAVDHVGAGEEVAHFWAPAAEGRHCLIITVLPDREPRRETAKATLTCCLTALPAGSSVRLHVESDAEAHAGKRR